MRMKMRHHIVMNYTIRRAKLDDAKTLCEAEKFYAKTPGFLVSDPSELKIENFLQKISTCYYIVDQKDNQIVGHAFLENMSMLRLSHIARLTIVVHEGHGRAGVGTPLMNDLISWAKASEDIEKIELLVRASNIAAISLYEKLGFQTEGRFKNRIKIADHHYQDDLSMALYL